MMDWKKIKVDGIDTIERQVLELRLNAGMIPYGACKFRIYETQSGSFVCRSEVAIRRDETSELEKIIGTGDTQESAFDSAARQLFEKAEQYFGLIKWNTTLKPTQVVHLKSFEF